MLLPRVLTAAVGIPLLLYLMHLGGFPFIVFVVGVSVLALHEYAMVLWLGGRGVQRIITVLGGGVVALAVALSGRPFPGANLTGLALACVVAAALLRELLRPRHSLDRAALTVLGTIFIGWNLGHLALVRDLSPHGKELTFLLFIAVWVTDSFAYLAGKAFGRHKLAEVVSPKKTWEGAAGGLLGAVLAVWLVRSYFLADALSPALTVGFALLIGVAGQVSDLSQSLVKRAAGVKDSAALLPGHGGVFDRMDSFLLLAPLFYYTAILAM